MFICLAAEAEQRIIVVKSSSSSWKKWKAQLYSAFCVFYVMNTVRFYCKKRHSNDVDDNDDGDKRMKWSDDSYN